VTEIVMVLLGTDHHPFDRLMGWADEAARCHPTTRVVVQHGASRPPSVAEGHDYLPYAQMMELLTLAAAAVCHGGPGVIMDARAVGHVPICVPRDPALGEHVDDHQLRFAALVNRAGVVTRANTIEVFHQALDPLLARPVSERPTTIPTDPATDAARELVCRELDRLLLPRPAHRRIRRSWDLPHVTRRQRTCGRA
jgi:UDP-N-acetylglucosamine transferase subunit ALG13